jgi:hyperosmotically inducible periplasmic protein
MSSAAFAVDPDAFPRFGMGGFMKSVHQRSVLATLLSGVAVLAFAGCSPGERQEVSNDASRAAQTARNEASQAVTNTGKAVDDASVTAKVKSTLLADNQVSGMKIDVDTSNGVVTLNGSVSTAAERARAEQLARDIEGVRSVRNYLSAP